MVSVPPVVSSSPVVAAMVMAAPSIALVPVEIQRAIDRDGAVADRGALQIDRGTGSHLHAGGGGVGDGQALKRQRAVVGRQQLLIVGDRAGIDGQRAAGRLKQPGSRSNGDGSAVDRAGAGRIQRPVDRDDAVADRGALQIDRGTGSHLHGGGGGVGDGQALKRQRAVAGRQQLLIVGDRAGIDGQRAAGRLKQPGSRSNGDGSAVDRAGAGRIQRAIDRDGAVADRGALQIDRGTGSHLHAGGGGVGDGQALKRQRAVVGRQQLLIVGDRAGIDGQRAAGRLKQPGSRSNGDGSAVDRAGAGRIQRAIDRDGAVADRGALQIDRGTGSHLHAGGGGVGDGQALKRQRAVVGRQQLLIVGDRAGIDGQRAAGRLKQPGSRSNGDGSAVDRAGAGRIQRAIDRDGAVADRGALQIDRGTGSHLHAGGGGVGDGQALKRQRAVVGRQQLLIVGDRAGIDGQRAAGRLKQPGSRSNGDGSAVDRAGAGRIKQPEDVDDTAVEIRAFEIQHRAVIHLRGAVGDADEVGDGVAIKHQQAIPGRQ